MEIIDTFPEIRIVSTPSTFVDYESAYKEMKDFIQGTADLKGLYMLINDKKDLVSGVCKAVSDFAKTKIDVITFDLTTECVKGIKNGTITASICQDPFSQGYYAVKILFKYLFDNELPKKSIYLSRLDVIYKENIDNYSNDLYNL